MSKMLSDFDKKQLLSRINDVNKAFKIKDDPIYLNKAMNRKIPLTHYLMIERIHRTNFEKETDMKLIMFCGVFDFVFTAGSWDYDSKVCLAVNRLNDFIFALKNLTLPERKKFIQDGN